MWSNILKFQKETIEKTDSLMSFVCVCGGGVVQRGEKGDKERLIKEMIQENFPLLSIQ